MNANNYARKVTDGVEVDELAELIEDGKLEMTLNGLDSHWEEVMRLAEAYGFIMQSYGGVATLATNAEYLKANGSKALADRLRMNNVNL